VIGVRLDAPQAPSSPSIGTCEDRGVGLRSSPTRIDRAPALKTRGSARQEINLFRSSGNSSCDPGLQEATMTLGTARQEINLFRSSGNSSCDPGLQEATMTLGKESL